MAFSTLTKKVRCRIFPPWIFPCLEDVSIKNWEWDRIPTAIELLDTQVFFGVRGSRGSVVGDFLECKGFCGGGGSCIPRSRVTTFHFFGFFNLRLLYPQKSQKIGPFLGADITCRGPSLQVLNLARGGEWFLEQTT